MKSNEVIARSGKSHLSNKEKKNLIENTLKLEANNDEIIAPAFLTETMREKFYKLAEELVKLKIFTHLDIDNLAQYVFNITEYEKTSSLITTMNSDDNKYMETLKIQEKFFKMAKVGANELGLNILTRNKLIIPTPEKKENKFKEF